MKLSDLIDHLQTMYAEVASYPGAEDPDIFLDIADFDTQRRYEVYTISWQPHKNGVGLIMSGGIGSVGPATMDSWLVTNLNYEEVLG
jgi:hypothetical protein